MVKFDNGMRKKGYSSEENTWEPYQNLKDNQQFKTYQKKMKKKK